MTETVTKKRETVAIYINHEPHTAMISATTLNGWLAVHKGLSKLNDDYTVEYNGNWTITHLPSGMRIRDGFDLKREAMKFATKLAPITEAAGTEDAEFGSSNIGPAFGILSDAIRIANSTQGNLRKALIDIGTLPEETS